jgi:hypothetical protein
VSRSNGVTPSEPRGKASVDIVTLASFEIPTTFRLGGLDAQMMSLLAEI